MVKIVITVYEENAGGTVLYHTGTLTSDGIPEIIFQKDSFVTVKKPKWIKNTRVNGEGQISHYIGSDDDEIPVILYLYGDNRKTNLQLVLDTFDKVLYLDASEVDSNISGKYVLGRNPNHRYEENKKYILLRMSWSKYNN